MSVEEVTLRVAKIREGTVIDHISAGRALIVLRILGITGREGFIVSVAMNVPSKKLGKKDIVKIEGRELSREEVDKIALVAPRATINIIRDYRVIEKHRVKLPKVIKNIIRCMNPACITNEREPVEPKFYVVSEEPVRLRCHYCGRIMEWPDILASLYKTSS
ncbi:aspartate carbamoyltransferase regulatory subunit [Candidatus Bathyarchaeota archaeon]|nr:MAG: aspartate carbamoyltransferase regulatory subunit [Candidatus Bathyarchaeota archaeon]